MCSVSCIHGLGFAGQLTCFKPIASVPVIPRLLLQFPSALILAALLKRWVHSFIHSKPMPCHAMPNGSIHSFIQSHAMPCQRLFEGPPAACSPAKCDQCALSCRWPRVPAPAGCHRWTTAQRVLMLGLQHLPYELEGVLATA